MATSTVLKIITTIEELTNHARLNSGVVDATVDLSRQNITSLPEEVTEIRGSLYCHNCPQLVSLGNLQSVAWGLYASDCPQLVSLGNLVSVGGGLFCNNCSQLVSLGKLQSIGGTFACYYNPQLSSLGNLEFVGGVFSCGNCPKLASFGSLKYVHGWLNCADSPLANDPQSLLKVVQGHIYLKCDRQGRHHCQDGCAIISKSHGEEFYWHGVKVPGFVILHPESITLAHINNEANAEVRRVMIFRYGLDRYLQDAGGTLIDDHPRFGKLWRISIEHRHAFMLEVVNSSAESDGSFKHYFLSVAPTCSGNPALPEGSPMDSSYKAAWSLHRIIWGLGIPYDPSVET